VKAASCSREAIDYEQLRSQVQHGLTHGSTLLPHGLAAWLCTAPPVVGSRNGAVSSSSPGMATSVASTATPSHGPLPITLASIILRLTKEAAHA
jgi:hypothetical protein